MRKPLSSLTFPHMLPLRLLPVFLLACLLALTGCIHAGGPRIQHYSFQVKVISGFLEGETYTGHFSVDTSKLTGQGDEHLPVEDIDFRCRGAAYGRDGFDAVPETWFHNGKFTELRLVGGPHDKRFGLNAGFGREQFGREV